MPSQTFAQRGKSAGMEIPHIPARGDGFRQLAPLHQNRATSPLEAKARLTARPSEPILLPKLRIEFADFPYLHVSDSAEATNL